MCLPDPEACSMMFCVRITDNLLWWFSRSLYEIRIRALGLWVCFWDSGLSVQGLGVGVQGLRYIGFQVERERESEIERGGESSTVDGQKFAWKCILKSWTVTSGSRLRLIQNSALSPNLRARNERNGSQRVPVAIWYILRAQGGSHIPTLRAKYIPYSYMDPLGFM